jgi:SNF2 family DNA or RNA helicase
MDRGTGKTWVALWGIEQLLAADEIDAALIFCPLTIAGHWLREAEKHSNLRAVVVDGTRKKREAIVRDPTHQLYIMGYDCGRTLGVVKEPHTRRRKAGALLSRWPRGRLAVISDESTWIKNATAARSWLLHEFADRQQYRMILTGAPVTDSGDEVWSQWRFFDRGATFGARYYPWRNSMFTQIACGMFVPKRGTYDRIKEGIAESAFLCSKEDALDLPPKLYETERVRMTGRQKSVYEQMAHDSIAEIRDEFGEVWDVQVAPTILAKLTRLRQIASGWLPGRDVGLEDFLSVKETRLKEFFREEWDGAPIVIWAWFRHTIERLADLCSVSATKRGDKKKGIVACEWMHGDTPRLDRDDIIQRFQAGQIRTLVAQPQTGGIGIDLFAASHAIYFEPDWWLEPRLQSEDRLHRIGQDAKHVLYTDLVCDGSIEVTIAERLQQKQNIAEFLLGIGDVERAIWGEV